MISSGALAPAHLGCSCALVGLLARGQQLAVQVHQPLRRHGVARQRRLQLLGQLLPRHDPLVHALLQARHLPRQLRHLLLQRGALGSHLHHPPIRRGAQPDFSGSPGQQHPALATAVAAHLQVLLREQVRLRRLGVKAVLE